MSKEAVVLIGHGGTATDTPKPMIGELKRLEGERQARREMKMSAREAELDKLVREWPRTKDNDAYKAGVEEIAAALEPKLAGRKLVTAYNEFCAPSVEAAIEALVNEGFARVTLISTMFTRGGIHAECEIPGIVTEARKNHPGVIVEYAWPFDADYIAGFLAGQLARALPAAKS
ncbi:MAG: CbiX/SirB N-terminal domain-containing protein [Elusimicrobia bacterium]|nr:CbiX/SirB N-terminal domain-containing protein [Elusimicrobiota bacterium]MDE2510774.1 CbiX/SirB N-terminal domain-containing protein [Elusimicrobiota bacterium]